MNYVYIESEPGLYTVGFYAPDGTWQPESDFGTREAAGRRVHYLNGGGFVDELDPRIAELEKRIEQLENVLQAHLENRIENRTTGERPIFRVKL